jgi:hypothetical protein
MPDKVVKFSPMVGRTRALWAAATAIMAVHLGAQQDPAALLARLRKLGLPEVAGPVPTLYSPSAEARAIRFQRSLTAAHSWYEKQLNIQVPITLAILDAETRQNVSEGQIPHSYPNFGLIVEPDRLGPAAQPPSGADRDHAAGGILQGEQGLFHEDGHVLAYFLKILSANDFVNELIANMFMDAYIGAQRPDLNFVLVDQRSGRVKVDGPRYTSLADLDYLYYRVGEANVYWFQWYLGRLADFLVRDQNFPSVVAKLQKAFPAGEVRPMTLDEINGRLASIRPGFLEAAGPLAGPTTIPRIAPSDCPEPKSGDRSSYVVVHNQTADSIELKSPN